MAQRLADGTRVTAAGAVFPGVLINEFDITLFALDAAWKYRGFSFDMKYYFRQLDRLRGIDLADARDQRPAQTRARLGCSISGSRTML